MWRVSDRQQEGKYTRAKATGQDIQMRIKELKTEDNLHFPLFEVKYQQGHCIVFDFLSFYML